MLRRPARLGLLIFTTNNGTCGTVSRPTEHDRLDAD